MSHDIYNDGTYSAKNPDWHNRESDWKASHLYNLIRPDQLTQLPKPLSIADIGCGYGGVLAGLCHRLATHGLAVRAMGYDISKQAVTEAAHRHPDIEFVYGDFLQDTRTFDLALLVDVLEHLSDPHRFLREVQKRCRYILVHLPLDRNWLGERMRPGYYYEYLKNDRGHLHFFDKNRALGLLVGGGFQIRNSRYTFWGKELYEWTSKAGRSAPVIRFLRTLGMGLAPDLSVRLLGGASLAVLGEAVKESAGPAGELH